MPTIRRTAGNGTYVTAAAPNSRRYQAAKRRCLVASSAANAYVRAPIPNAVLGRSVTSAILILDTDPAGLASSPTSRTITARRHAEPPPRYAQMTWADRLLELAGSTACSQSMGANAMMVTIDVTAEVQAVASGEEYHGFRITSDSTDQWAFYGWETDSAPRLEITYSLAPAEPIGLAPDGGVVSLEDPTFCWEGIEDVTAVHVQLIEVGGTFNSPLWTSGWVNLGESTTGPVDGRYRTANDTTFPGLVDGTSYRWRVRRRSAEGDSDWSAAADITRHVKPTVTIINPTFASGDPTPLTQWLVSPDVQIAYRVQRLRVNGSLWDDSLRQGDPATRAYQLEKGPRFDEVGATERVRVWDRNDRVASPGDPVFTEATLAWSFEASATFAHISTISATQPSGIPRVKLTWDRNAGTPDKWQIWRRIESEYNKWLLMDTFDGTEHMFGTLWTWTDWPPPNATVEYAVLPVIGSETPPIGGAPRALVVMDKPGVWLFSRENPDRWVVLGDDCISLPLTETSAVFNPPGAPHPFKRFTALKGRDGEVTDGFLDDDSDSGKTVGQMVSDLDWIRRRPLRDYQLAWGLNSIKVNVLDLDWDADFTTAMPGHVRQRVHFRAFQVDEIAEAYLT